VNPEQIYAGVDVYNALLNAEDPPIFGALALDVAAVTMPALTETSLARFGDVLRHSGVLDRCGKVASWSADCSATKPSTSEHSGTE
jgi:hypothetical protein